MFHVLRGPSGSRQSPKKCLTSFCNPEALVPVIFPMTRWYPCSAVSINIPQSTEISNMDQYPHIDVLRSFSPIRSRISTRNSSSQFWNLTENLMFFVKFFCHDGPPMHLQDRFWQIAVYFFGTRLFLQNFAGKIIDLWKIQKFCQQLSSQSRIGYWISEVTK